MFEFGIKSDIDQLAQAFDKTVAAQIPFATSLALNSIATLCKQSLRAEMEHVFDRPRSYTLNSLFVKPSTKTNLTATVGHKDQSGSGTPAAEYLQAEIQGGAREATPFERDLDDAIHGIGALVPAQGAKLDAAGGIAKSMRMAAIRASQGKSGSDPKGMFIIPVGSASHLAPGVYQRVPIRVKIKKKKVNGKVVSVTSTGGGSRLKCIMLFKPKANYQPRYDLLGVVDHTIQTTYEREFAAAMDRALSTAKVKV